MFALSLRSFWPIEDSDTRKVLCEIADRIYWQRNLEDNPRDDDRPWDSVAVILEDLGIKQEWLDFLERNGWIKIENDRVTMAEGIFEFVIKKANEELE